MSVTVPYRFMLLALPLVGCAGDGGTGGSPVVATVRVSPPATTLPVGQTQQLTAAPLDAKGAELQGLSVAWTTSNSAVASVSNAGVVTAVGGGTVTITATSEGKAGRAAVTIKAFTALANGVGLAVPATAAGDAEFYTITVPPGSDSMVAIVSVPPEGSGSGNPDLSVYTGTSLAVIACSAAVIGADQCSIALAGPATYAIKVSAATGFNGYEVRAAHNGRFLVQSLTAGGGYTCARTSGGTGYCWGANAPGSLGDGTIIDRFTPVPVAGGLTFANLSAGGIHTCGLTSTGTAYCWGANALGRLGDGTTTDRATPVPVAGGLSFSSLSAGDGHTCGLTSTGAAYCWGWNGFGQLGDGTTTLRLTPVPVDGGLTFSSLSSGGYHTCGLTSTGVAYCWGWNGFGQLGDGTTTNRSAPMAVAGGLSFSSLRGGEYHTCGLASTGPAYCWGWNGFGQLGDGTMTNRLTPTPVTGGPIFSSLTASRTGGVFSTHTCGLTTSGVAYCWGRNASGQLGDGTTTKSSHAHPVDRRTHLHEPQRGWVPYLWLGKHRCGLLLGNQRNRAARGRDHYLPGNAGTGALPVINCPSGLRQLLPLRQQ